MQILYSFFHGNGACSVFDYVSVAFGIFHNAHLMGTHAKIHEHITVITGIELVVVSKNKPGTKAVAFFITFFAFICEFYTWKERKTNNAPLKWMFFPCAPKPTRKESYIYINVRQESGKSSKQKTLFWHIWQILRFRTGTASYEPPRRHRVSLDFQYCWM